MIHHLSYDSSRMERLDSIEGGGEGTLGQAFRIHVQGSRRLGALKDLGPVSARQQRGNGLR